MEEEERGEGKSRKRRRNKKGGKRTQIDLINSINHVVERLRKRENGQRKKKKFRRELKM